MCVAFDRKYKENQVIGAIRILRLSGISDSDIIAKVTDAFNVTKDYVNTLLELQEA